jgi:hypothetical protein
MAGRKDDIENRVKWDDVRQLASGNPFTAIWTVFLWVIATSPRLVAFVLIIFIVLIIRPELFSATFLIQCLKELVSKIWK